jgi:ATP-dependent Clp protease ATP-binding subunit ClpA
MDALRKHFRPRFLNRIDQTALFDRLGDNCGRSLCFP